MPKGFPGLAKSNNFWVFEPDALDAIRLGVNLRGEYDDDYLEELGRSIVVKGQLQPGLIRRGTDDAPILTAGFCRLEAIKRVNADPEGFYIRWLEDTEATIPPPSIPPSALPFAAKLVTVTSEDEALEINWEENERRRPLDVIAKARAAVELERLGWDRTKIAGLMHVSQARVSQIIDLLRLPEETQAAVRHGDMNEASARAMLGADESDVKTWTEEVVRGEKKAKEAAEEAKAKKREKGKPVARTLAQLKKLLDYIGTGPAVAVLRWVKGEATDEELEEGLADKDE